MANLRAWLSKQKWIAPIWDLLAGVNNKVTSWSQFGEDVLVISLIRELERYGYTGIPKLYVDVGACVPLRGSNTFSLRNMGWRGYLIEPLPKSTMSFRVLRPGDELVQACVSTETRDVEFFSFGSGQVFNTADPIQAAEVERRTGRSAQRQVVPSISLDKLIASKGLAPKDIGLLSIDVEGRELDVLASMSSSDEGPAIIVVEILKAKILELANSELYQALHSRGYHLYACSPPSFVFVRNDINSEILSWWQ